MRLILLMLTFSLLNGCASIIAHKTNYGPTLYPGFYAGSKADFSLIALPFTCKYEGCEFAYFWPIILPFAAVDFPLSLLADTAFLPKQYIYAGKNKLSKKDMWQSSQVSMPSAGK